MGQGDPDEVSMQQQMFFQSAVQAGNCDKAECAEAFEPCSVLSETAMCCGSAADISANAYLFGRLLTQAQSAVVAATQRAQKFQARQHHQQALSRVKQSCYRHGKWW